MIYQISDNVFRNYNREDAGTAPGEPDKTLRFCTLNSAVFCLTFWGPVPRMGSPFITTLTQIRFGEEGRGKDE